MQARRHDCRTPPILQAWKPPKIREWDKHFPLHACSPIRHKRGRPESFPRMIRRKPEKPVNRLQTRALGLDGLNIDSRYTFCNVGYGRRFLFACVGGGRGVFSKPESKFRNGWGHTSKNKICAVALRQHIRCPTDRGYILRRYGLGMQRPSGGACMVGCAVLRST